MNNSKTEVIYFGSTKQLQKCHQTYMLINGERIDITDCVKYLGTYLDRLLTFNKHVKIKSQKAMYNVFRIKQIRKYLTQEACEILTCSLVLSHVDYCNGLLIGCAQYVEKQLQRVLNFAGKVTLNCDWYSSASDCLRDLHWLPVKYHVQFKVILMMHNCVNSKAP